jgi:flagellar biosynthetic protein FliR
MIITVTQVLIFLLIVSRMVGVFAFAPIFSHKQLITTGKVAIVIWTAGLLVFVIPLPNILPSNGLAYGLAIITEVFIGSLIGFISDLFISGVEFCGTLMDTQAGLSVASMLDPGSGKQVTLFSYMLKWASMMVFFAIDGHHMILTALVQSMTILPIGNPMSLAQVSEGAHYLVQLGGYVFYLGVQLAAPILLVIFLVDFGFGMLNKVAEQVNVFQLGFQIKPTVSLIVFLAIIPGLNGRVYEIMEDVIEYILKLFYALQG